jgi:histidyl-tRNA synthetase
MSTTKQKSHAPAAFLKHATEVASFYGFRPVREIEKMAGRATGASRGIYTFDVAAGVLGTSVENRPLTVPGRQEPALAFYASPSPSHMPAHYPAPHEVGEFGLQVVGSTESLGEVLLIKTVSAIITEWGGAVSRIRLNAMGDKDSQQRFLREASTHLRKHAGELGECCRTQAAAEPFLAYRCNVPACREVLENGPRPVTFLSEKSRAHFRTVLEQLENLGLPYELDDLLVGDAREPRVSFALDLAEDDATIIAVTGGRYDDYLRRLTGRSGSAGVHAGIYFRKRGADRGNFSSVLPPKNPKIYFVQLGLRAKLQGLAVVDMLREAHVPVSQSFDASRLGMQLSAAQQSGVSHLLIMGQREALDGTIIVRSTANSSQTILQLTALPRFLKTLR